jgi:hypothetical protein
MPHVMFWHSTTLHEKWPDANKVEFRIGIDRDRGPMLPTWPGDVVRDFSHAIGRWQDANPQRELVAMTTACALAVPGDLHPFNATVVLHHVAKPAEPSATEGEDHAQQDGA